MFALVDCNNFYASCERLFRPDLQNKPIIVLSSNDGCVIARSNEAKALGIAMGVPYFKVQGLCKQYQVAVFSSNFALYADLSQRVMYTIEESWPHVEIYSIDEAFLDLSTMPEALRASFCEGLQKKILKHTGIPTSIGMGPSKTLAKVANYLCKKFLKAPFFNLSATSEWLKRVPVTEVWGIGRRWSKQLMAIGVSSAWDLAQMNPGFVRKQFNVVMMRTVLELQGMSCGDLSVEKAKKRILSSKSFGSLQADYDSVAAALSSHCYRAVEKLRAQDSLVKRLVVFVHTSRYREDLAQHHQAIEVNLITPSDDLRVITRLAKEGLARLFKEGYHYKKTGVCLEELILKKEVQLDLFTPVSQEDRDKSEKFMELLEQVNQKFGRHTLHLAAEDRLQPWDSRLQMRSPRYTTSWSELAKVTS